MSERGFDQALLARLEDAGLNASAPPQQRWLDGWLVRFSPGKAKRARCINPVADGRMSTERKLQLAAEVYADAGLPMLVRITPFSRPAGLVKQLDVQGLQSFDDTRVMLADTAAVAPRRPRRLPAGLLLQAVGHAAFAQTVGQMRGSPLAQREAHAQRLELAPVPFVAFVLRRREDGAALACGQYAIESNLVGLYDVYTMPSQRGKGYAKLLCEHMLTEAARRNAGVAYLQVDETNAAARKLYDRLGFVEGYRYHYRGEAETAPRRSADLQADPFGAGRADAVADPAARS